MVVLTHTTNMHQTTKCGFVLWVIYLISLSESKPNELKNDNTTTTEPQPPNSSFPVETARFVVHQADWVSLATLSILEQIEGYPFVNIASMADGPVNDSTGIPYFLLTAYDFSVKNFRVDNKCTIMATLETTNYCRQKKFDPEDPRCARVMLSGRMDQINEADGEYTFARNALFSRHPFFEQFPTSHNFFVAKLNISKIVMLFKAGGPSNITVEDYLSFNFNTDMNTI